MSKAVMISIHPKWCELIASGKKTVEIRKTKPHAILPLKCYIYQTKGAKENPIVTNDVGETFYILEIGKVIGEFVCHDITRFDVPFPAYWDQVDKATLDAACLKYGEAHNYLGHRTGWAWHISDLRIYDKPKNLSDFKRWNRTEENSPCAHTKALYEPCETCKECNLTRPPQSWCYVEELRGND